MPLGQAVKNSNYPQSEAGAPHTQGVQSNKRKATEHGNAENNKKPRDSTFGKGGHDWKVDFWLNEIESMYIT
jgi:hypothetical protein